MAFITTEEVKNIRTQLKKELPNLKFSVKKINYSKVSITIKSGNLDFRGALVKEQNGDYLQVFRDFKSQFAKDEKVVEALQKVNDIAFSQNYHDNSDAMTDYFDVAYYVSIKIGDYDKSYELRAA